MTWLVPTVAEVVRGTSKVDGVWFGVLVVDGMSGIVDKLVLDGDDNVDENDCALAEGCRSFEVFSARWNILDKVSAGCTSAVSVLVGVALLPASESSDPAAVDSVVGGLDDVISTWPNALVARTFAAGLLVDTTSGINGVAVGNVEEVAAKTEASGLAAIKVVIDEEDIGSVVEVWI